MTKYKGHTVRSGKWWSIEVTEGLPANYSGRTQARRLNDIEKVTADMLSELLEVDVDPADIELSVEAPESVKSAQDALTVAEANEAAARDIAFKARRLVAQLVIGEGLTMREAGRLLGISHQRVKQLVDS